MDISIAFDKDFNDLLRQLFSIGEKDKAIKARSAVAELQMTGEIISIPRTNHGESRLKGIDKFDLGGGYRLIAQRVSDTDSMTYAFLFAGSHDESEYWLNSHIGYKWIKKESDGTLDFIKVSNNEDSLIIDPDLSTPRDLLSTPLLKDIREDEWDIIDPNIQCKEYALKVSSADWERDAKGVLRHIQQLEGGNSITLFSDLFHHAHNKQWGKLHRRIELLEGASRIAYESEIHQELNNRKNNEKYVTWEDCKQLYKDHPEDDWADWMLFLHPEQNKWVDIDLKGPARIRGISGSGKTCVIIHRIRYLAQKYKQAILVITLTISMKHLLDQLIDKLLGKEKYFVNVMTLNSLCRELIRDYGESQYYFNMIDDDTRKDMETNTMTMVRNHKSFQLSPFTGFDSEKLRAYLSEELKYIRQRLIPDEYSEYLDTKLFPRKTRIIPLQKSDREMIYPALLKWDESLKGIDNKERFDYEKTIQIALRLLINYKSKLHWRCVLVDEVQDLSQNEVRLLSLLNSPEGNSVKTIINGLFLVGDGAQSIYKKGFSLNRLGVAIKGRSHVFRKNYRNSFEILKAAYGLIENYKFADHDEEDFVTPVLPEFSERHGLKPMVIKCNNAAKEIDFVYNQIESLSENINRAQVCVVAPNKKLRNNMMEKLEEGSIEYSELRDDAYTDSDVIKISTIEQSKGHEFSVMFIIGANEGILPNKLVNETDMWRQASRLYVAMTRAKDYLYLTYTSNNHNTRSRLLRPILPYCSLLEYKNNKLKILE